MGSKQRREQREAGERRTVTRRRVLKGLAGVAGATALAAAGYEFWPRKKSTHLLMRFARHGTERDAKSLDPLIAEFKPHVLLMEAAATTEAQARDAERIYESKPTPELHRTNGPFFGHLNTLINKHGLRVHVLERFTGRESREIKDDIRRGKALLLDALNQSINEKPDEALKTARQAFTTLESTYKRREAHVKQQLAQLREQLESRFPEFKRKGEVRALLLYGVHHAHLANEIDRSKFDTVSAKIQAPAHGFSPDYALGEVTDTRKLTDEELARRIVAIPLVSHLQSLKLGEFNASAVANVIARQIDTGKFRGISREASSRRFMRPEQAIALAIEKQGIEVPRTKRDALAFLRKHNVSIEPED